MSYTLKYTGAEIDDILDRAAPSGALDTAIAAKQDALTFDDEPTENSNNPVKSGGIYDAIQAGGATALGAYPTDTITDADVASFPDGADGVPVKSFVGSIVPIQDLHGYEYPWPAGGGANKWDEVAEAGGINDTTGQNATASGQFRSVNYIPVNPSTDYYVCYGGTASSHNIYVYFYASDQSFIGRASISWSYNVANKTITTPSNCGFMRFKAQIQGESTYNNNIAINYPSSVTTYSPYSNICPISGWTGCNIGVTGGNVWDEQWELGTFNTDGSEAPSTTQIRAKNYIPVIGGTKYLFHAGTERVSRIYWYDANKGFIEQVVNQYSANYVSTAPATAKYMRFGLPVAYGTTYNNNVSVNVPYTDTSYHAYTGNKVIPISWQTEAGTVYGGTLTYLGGGKYSLQATHTIDDLGNRSWTAGQNNVYYTADYSATIKKPNNTASLGNYYCTALKQVTAASLPTYGDYTNGVYNVTNNGRMYAKYTDAETTKELFTAAVTGVKFVYELATLPDPIIVSADDLETLLGSNTAWLNCGSVTELTYRADTALYVQKLLNGGALSTLSMTPQPLSLGRVGVLLEQEEEPEVEEATEEPEEQPEEQAEEE